MQFKLLASLLFCSATLFKHFYLAKQFFSLFSVYDLLFYSFFCLNVKVAYCCNNILPDLIKGQAFQSGS